MVVVGLGEFLGRDMLTVVDEIRQRILNGEIASLAVVGEVMGQQHPAIAYCGRFHTDPYRALLALQHASFRLHRHVDDDDH